MRNFEAVEREGEETDRKQSKKPKRNKRERECVCDFRVLERERERDERTFEMVIACEEAKKDRVLFMSTSDGPCVVWGGPGGVLVSLSSGYLLRKIKPFASVAVIFKFFGSMLLLPIC